MSAAMRVGPTLNEQIWIDNRLGRVGLLEGVTTDAIFHDRFRVHVISHGLANLPAGTKGGAPESWAQLFERLYHEPLTSQPQQSGEI